MRTKILLLLTFLTCGVISAQVKDTLRTLIITEARIDDARRSYVEITNIGTEAIDLGEFEIGKIEPWQTPLDDDYNASENYFFMLPDRQLGPGESFLIAMVYDWGPEMWLLAPEDYDPFLTKREMWSMADIKLHYPESPTSAVSDSVTPTYRLLEFWGGRECIYIRQHRYDGDGNHVDSILIDQVNGIWRGTDGTRWGGQDYSPIDVAGMPNGSRDATLVRKFSVEQGQMNFDELGRGETAEESEWITIPHQAGGTWADNVRRLFWTAKNHVNATLTAETLVPLSDDVVVDFTAKTITVPFGIRRDDSIMFQFEYTPGLAWHYDYNHTPADSASVAAKTGDSLTIYACGNEVDIERFRIIVAEPTASAKIAIPKKAPNAEGFYAGVTDPVYSISDGLELDTIGTARFGGIPFATRVDTLVKYIEIPSNANWSMVWKNGAERTDLVDGDMLRITANDGSTKDYYIKVDKYRKSHNAYLSAINWPDMPEELIDNYGFIGDTIPNFNNNKYNYIVTLPSTVKDVPALLAHKQDFNSTVKVTRAQGLDAGITGRTVSFEVTAEDDTSKRTYTVQLDLEIEDVNKEVYKAEPFISEFVFREQWANNFIEVVNPGNVTLDLSNYMFVWGTFTSPAAAIQSNGTVDDFENRYLKYIPGRKWVDEANWATTPATVVPDVTVNSFVLPGDVFVVADIRQMGDLQNGVNDLTYETWWAAQNSDIDLSPLHTPFDGGIPGNQALYTNGNWFLFKILNDTVRTGGKPATNPADFELIDFFGSLDGTATPTIGGESLAQQTNYRRKPHIQKGNPVPGASYGTDWTSSEWEMKNLTYYNTKQIPWALNHLMAAEDVGSHYMLSSTDYRSTVTSLYYKVSRGYAEDQSIDGIATGTTIEEFVNKLVKVNEGQSFLFKSNGDTLELADVLADNDSLIVTSANEINTTYYVLGVGEGLSRDAKLTSTVYTVSESGNTGNVSNIEAGTKLSAVLSNVTKHAGATITVLDGVGAYVPLKVMGYDSLYTDVLVSPDMFFEVISESKLDTILYALKLNSDASSAFVISSVYEVNPGMISKVPQGTTTAGFLGNLIPCEGATMMVIDKLGFQRPWGDIASDDILVVTSEDGTVEQSYYIELIGTVKTVVFLLSEVYSVDQIDNVISGADINDQTTVVAFIANLSASEGASFAVTNATGTPKTSGTLVNGDKVVVTALDGTVRTYVIEVIVSTNNRLENNINVFPNPSDGSYTISGLKAGNRIQVFNIVGTLVLDKYAAGDNEPVNIQKQRSGVYFITVSDNANVVGRYKVVKE